MPNKTKFTQWQQHNFVSFIVNFFDLVTVEQREVWQLVSDVDTCVYAILTLTVEWDRPQPGAGGQR